MLEHSKTLDAARSQHEGRTSRRRGVLARLGAAALVTVLTLGGAAIAVTAADANTCPTNAGPDLYVDHLTPASPITGPRTGAPSPAGCAFRTITAALDAAAPHPDATYRLILRGATDRKPLVLASERFPMALTPNITITTVDDPAVGGGGFVPARYRIDFAKPSPMALWVTGGELRGLTVRNKLSPDSEQLVACYRGAFTAVSVVLDGAPLRTGRVGTGVIIGGSCSATLETTTVRGFRGDGVQIETSGAVQLHNIDISANGRDGLRILEASSDATGPTCSPAAGIELPLFCPAVVLNGDRPTLRSLSLIHNNGGNGVTVGDPTTHEPIAAIVGDLDIYENAGDGIALQPFDPTLTRVDLLDNDVYTNGAHGMRITPTEVHFAQNKSHNNYLHQMLFDGGGVGYEFTVDSPTHASDAGANAVYCYTAAQRGFGIFASNISSVIVRHTEFEGGGTGLKDYGAQSGSTISVQQNATAITICP
jgi:hypothetical protein